jgi:hypothetical protein
MRFCMTPRGIAFCRTTTNWSSFASRTASGGCCRARSFSAEPTCSRIASTSMTIGTVWSTDARYANYKDYDGISFPSRIEISRPQEEYDITLNMLKLEINKPLRDDQFALQQPPGAEVVHLDRSRSRSQACAFRRQETAINPALHAHACDTLSVIPKRSEGSWFLPSRTQVMVKANTKDPGCARDDKRLRTG